MSQSIKLGAKNQFYYSAACYAPDGSAKVTTYDGVRKTGRELLPTDYWRYCDVAYPKRPSCHDIRDHEAITNPVLEAIAVKVWLRKVYSRQCDGYNAYTIYFNMHDALWYADTQHVSNPDARIRVTPHWAIQLGTHLHIINANASTIDYHVNNVEGSTPERN